MSKTSQLVHITFRVEEEERRELKSLAASLGTTYQSLLRKQVRTLIREGKKTVTKAPAAQLAPSAPSPDQVEGRIAEIRENAIAMGQDPDRTIKFVLQEWGYDPAAFPSLYSPVT